MQYYLNTTGILQVILHAELMQICPRRACKIACFCRQKYMQCASKNTRIAGENTCQIQAKITANAGKNTRTIADKNTRNCTRNYLQMQAICYHTAGKFTCKLHLHLTIEKIWCPQKINIIWASYFQRRDKTSIVFCSVSSERGNKLPAKILQYYLVTPSLGKWILELLWKISFIKSNALFFLLIIQWFSKIQ